MSKAKRTKKVDAILEQFERDHAEIKKWHDEVFERANPAVIQEIAEIEAEPIVHADITPLDARGRELMEKLRMVQAFTPAAFHSDIKSEIYNRSIRWGDTKTIKYARDRSVWDDVRDWVGDLCDWGIDHHVAANAIYMESDAFHFEGLFCIGRNTSPALIEKLIGAYVELYRKIHGIAEPAAAINDMAAKLNKIQTGVDAAGRDAHAGRIAAEKIADEFLGWRAWIAECVRKGGDVKVSPDKLKLFGAARDAIWELWQRFKDDDADCEMPNNELRKQGQKRTYAECVELYGADVIYTSPITGRMYYLREFCPDGKELEKVINAARMHKARKGTAKTSPHKRRTTKARK